MRLQKLFDTDVSVVGQGWHVVIVVSCRVTLQVWFCFGTTHFCEPCHSGPGLSNITGPCSFLAGKKVEGTDKCPLGIKHPPGEW